MKQVLSVTTVLVCLIFSAHAFAAERGTEEYKKLAEYKKARREQKVDPSAPPKEKSFFQREAERSGLAGTAAMFGNAAAKIVPLDKPNSRKKDA